MLLPVRPDVDAHQSASGAGPRPVQGEPADHALGRSRGGWTTKIHLAADASQTVLSVVLTAGQRGDAPQFQPVLERIKVPRSGRAGRDGALVFR